jgi:hypothetical protein
LNLNLFGKKEEKEKEIDGKYFGRTCQTVLEMDNVVKEKIVYGEQQRKMERRSKTQINQKR